MPMAMTSLARLGKDHMFLWAWGINGCFSVIGAALVPIIATSFGLTAVLMVARRRLSAGDPRLLRGAAAAADGRARCRMRCRGRRGDSWRYRLGAALALHGADHGAPARKRRNGSLRRWPRAKTELVPFDNSPFPYRGIVPEKDKPFLDVTEGERRGHTSPRGGVYWEDLTYSDRRVAAATSRAASIRAGRR